MDKQNLRIRFLILPAAVVAFSAISHCQGAQTLTTEQLQQIEQKVLLEQQNIENWYTSRLEQLWLSASRQALKLSQAQRMLWTKFIDLYYQPDYLYTYFLTKPGGFIISKRQQSNKKIQRLRDAMTESYFLTAAADFLMDREAYDLLKTIVENKEQSLLIRSEAKKILKIMERSRLDIAQAENRRKALLADLQQWQTVEKENLLKQWRPGKLATQYGVVTAINYGDKNLFAMVGDDIVYPGSKINNVKVVDIQRYKIEFEKNRKSWIQKIGESANHIWTN